MMWFLVSIKDKLFTHLKLNKANKDIKISSDFIVGYPGETEKDFENTIDLIKEVGFINSYSFIFSPRPGTPAATKKVNMDYALSKKYGKVIQNKNWDTDGNVGKIFYTNYSPKYRFKTRELWQFIAIRQFKRAVAKIYPKNWKKYVVMKGKMRVADMYKNKKK